jgi:hypothetical protein
MMLDLLKKVIFAIEIRVFQGRRLTRPVFNFFRRDPASRKRALLVYRVIPFHLGKDHPAFRYHQNFKQAMQIATVLDEAGYLVDVAEMGDRKFRAESPYDLVMSHRVDYEGLEKAIGPGTMKVYLSAGMNHIAHNRNQEIRAEYFLERKGKKLRNLPRDQEDMPFLKIADAVVGFGNDCTRNSWKSAFAGPIYNFENYSLRWLQPERRDWDSAKLNFLFFGSHLQLSKGLDITLDVFSQFKDVHLFVCSHYQKDADFCKIYDKELFHTANIHPCGWIDIGGRKFKELVAQCGFVILPSCSEASAGSVVNAMATGLIPIVTPEVGIDMDDFGFCLSDFRVETIAEVVRSVSRMSAEELVLRSQKVLDVSANRLSEEAFLKRWREIIGDLVQTSRKG